MKRILSSSLVYAAVLTMALLPQVALAESHEGGDTTPPPYLMIHYDDVDPDKAPAFEKNAKGWVAAFKEAGLSAEYGWNMYAGPNFTYAFVSDVPNYAYLDDNEARMEEIGEAIGAEKMGKLMAGSVSNSHRHEFAKRMAKLSYIPEGGMGKVSFVHLAKHSVKPGMEEQFKELAAKVIAAFEKSGRPLPVLGSEVQFGDGNYQFATFATDAAAYHSAPPVPAVLAEAYGEEEAEAMLATWRECITDYETSDWQFRPDLSYMPDMEGEQLESKMYSLATELQSIVQMRVEIAPMAIGDHQDLYSPRPTATS